MKPIQLTLLTLLCIPAVILFASRGSSTEQQAGAAPTAYNAELVARGKYLVDFGGCNDCHTPLKVTDKGPEPDRTRLLSGHPQEVKLPPPDLKPGPWFAATAGMTAWAGPWGTTYAVNLTPDNKTGMGAWTEEMFIMAMRTGRHMGYGRPILPPMPWQAVGGLTDDDLKAVFAYLRSIPPIQNQVPLPVGPEGEITYE